jgi:hypothetical protein
MAEVFGYRIDDFSTEAQRHRTHHLCPFNNKVPNCTKDKANDPLGVCSIYNRNDVTVTCPIRFRENWLIATDAAEFFFPPGTNWTSLTEIRLDDANGKSAGNIDVVLVSYDDEGRLTDFGALEVQAVYISGNVRKPFASYMENPPAHAQLNWQGQKDYPRPDFLSSSRKRLAPQLIYKGGILHSWGRKMAVAVDKAFFAELPALPQVDPADAEVVWLIYDLPLGAQDNRYHMTRVQAVYTQFTAALDRITTATPGPEARFRDLLQSRLDQKHRAARLGPALISLAEVFEDTSGEAVEEE